MEWRTFAIRRGILAAYSESARTITRAAGFEVRERNLASNGGQPARIRAMEVTPEIFDVLSTGPALGRRFFDADAQEHAAPVVILTDALWRARFGGNTAVVGRRAELDGVSTEIVGVVGDVRTFGLREEVRPMA